MPDSPQDAGQGAALSLEETAERYNFPLSQLQRRVLTGRIPGAFQVTLPDGGHAWRIPVSSMVALGYRQVQGPVETPAAPAASPAAGHLRWGAGDAISPKPEPPSAAESQLVSRLSEVEARFARLKEQEQRAIQQVAARRSELDARESAIAAHERKLASSAAAAAAAAANGSEHAAPSAATAEELAKVAAIKRQIRFEQAELAATRATVHQELADIRAAEDRIRIATELLERRERSVAARERRLEEWTGRNLAHSGQD